MRKWQTSITAELHRAFTPPFDSAFDAGAKATPAAKPGRRSEGVGGGLAGCDVLIGRILAVVDAYRFVVAGRARHVALDLAGFVRLQAFLARVAVRPSVRAAMRAEGPFAA